MKQFAIVLVSVLALAAQAQFIEHEDRDDVVRLGDGGDEGGSPARLAPAAASLGDGDPAALDPAPDQAINVIQ